MTGGPKISIITPSLNHGRFLRETIRSIESQSFVDYEHIVVDGGSTDGTLEILHEHPGLRWISERDDCILEAYWKAIRMATGSYIVQCCVSDGFLDADWLQRCATVLDGEPEISLVWGYPRYMSEDGVLGEVSYPEFRSRAAPQGKEFLALWLATGFWLPEGNYCVRAEVLRECFPPNAPDSPCRINPALQFNYNFNTSGYLPRFLPVIANYGRTHAGQRGQTLRDVESEILAAYLQDVRGYKKRLFQREVVHRFRDGQGRIIGEVAAGDLSRYRMEILKWRLKRFCLSARRIMRYDARTLLRKVRAKLGAPPKGEYVSGGT